MSAVKITVLNLLNTGKTVVVVTHSYGSIPGIAALADLSLDARKERGLANGVEAVVVISGFYLPVGLTMLGIMGGQLPPQYLHEKTPHYTSTVLARSTPCTMISSITKLSKPSGV